MDLTKPQKLIYDMDMFAGGAISVICGSMLCRGKREVDELAAAVNALFQINDALRIRIGEKDGTPEQTVSPYHEKKIEVLHFETKTELDNYAEKYAVEALDLFGILCEIKIVLLPGQYGILTKMHHMIGDAWSLSLLGNQFNAILSGETPEAYSYTDYVTAEKEYLQGKRYGKDKAFFLEQFSKCDEVTYLSEKQSKTSAANRKTFIIGKDKTGQISSYLERRETTVFTLFAAALSVYMNRTKMNAEKFYIGTAVLNRTTAKEKQTVGMFINTVPMLMELDNNKSFVENLNAAQSSIFSVFRHQKYNYGDVLNALRAERNFGEKLYDVVLSYQNATMDGDCESTWYHCGEQTESLQIHIEDRDHDGIFRLHFDYLTEKFTEHEIDKLFEHITNLLYSAIEDDSKKPYELQILSADERQKLLYDFNDTTVNYPEDKCVHELFEEQVEKAPDKVALVACDKTLTYQELNEEANRIAHSLVEMGIRKNDIIAFQISRKSYLISFMLGVLKAGASYMPIDPNYPKDRVDYMVQDSGAKFCVDDELVKKLLSNVDSSDLHIYNSPEERFCVLHTSGSTGMPKCAAIKHRNMENFIYSNLQLLNGIDYVIAINTVTFDVFEMDTVFSLIGGNTCVLASENQQFDQSEFEAMMNKYQNCLFWATPTKMGNYIKNSENKEFLKYISTYVVGGEVLKQDFVNTVFEHNPDIKIYTVYGPTETLIYSTFVEIKNI